MEVAHEALLREWATLATWIEERREAADRWFVEHWSDYGSEEIEAAFVHYPRAVLPVLDLAE